MHGKHASRQSGRHSSARTKRPHAHVRKQAAKQANMHAIERRDKETDTYVHTRVVTYTAVPCLNVFHCSSAM